MGDVLDLTRMHPGRKPPRVRGVGRVADEPRAILVALTEIPTDDELRYLQEVMARAVACMPDFASEGGRGG